MRILMVVALAALLPLATSCQAELSGVQKKPMAGADKPAPRPIVSMHFHHPLPWLVTGGQPAVEEWLQLRGRDVTTVVNLRTDAEMGKRDEAAEVRAANLVYQHMPISGAADIDTEHADALWKQIQAAPGRVMVHCASGNRVGALLAIGAARHGDMSPQKALDFGRRAGLTKLEPKVREVLGLPPKSDGL